MGDINPKGRLVVHISRLLDLEEDERDEYFAEQIEDPVLRKKLRQALAARSSEYLQEAAVGLSTRGISLLQAALGEVGIASEPMFLPNSVVGRYEVVGHIGTGGSSEIYLAVDREAQNHVALKVLRSVDDSFRDTLKREYQLLARLDHPGIVRYMAQDVDSQGTPFFVMEYVDGEHITEYCLNRNLGTKEIVGLLVELCSAIEYAHNNLVVHRDLKPANVLVTNDGQLKVLDFGIGQDVRIELDEQQPATANQLGVALRTRFSRLTPAYAAPEQFVGEAAKPAADVYAIGMLCFELLAQRRPYDLSGMSIEEARQVVGSADRSLLSLFEGTRRGDLTTTATNGWRQFGKELDAIVQKALSVQSNDRYRTAGELKRDLLNLLSRRPVGAYKSTPSYRFYLFVQRNRSAVIVTIAILLFGLLSVFRIVGERNRANEAAIEAREQRLTADQAVAFLVDVLSAADPQNPDRSVRTDTMSVREMLDLATSDISNVSGDNTALELRLLNTVGQAYSRIGELAIADSLLRLAEMKWRSASAIDSIEFSQTLDLLGTNLQRQNSYEEARPYLEEAFAIKLRNTASGTASMVDVGNQASNLSVYLEDVGDTSGALRYAKLAVGIYESEPLAPQADRLSMQHNLANALRRVGEFQEAIELMSLVVDEREILLGDHPDTAATYNILGALYADIGEYELAAEALRRALQVDKATLGRSHEFVAGDMELLAGVLIETRKFREAIELLEQALELRIANHGLEDPDTAISLRLLGVALAESGQFERATQLLKDAEQIELQVAESRKHMLAATYLAFGRLELAQENLTDAESYIDRCLSLRREVYGEQHVRVANALLFKAEVALRTNRRDAAIHLSEQAIQIYEGLNTPRSHPDYERADDIIDSANTSL